MKTKNDLFKIGNIPKKAEYRFFLSKLPGIVYDLSLIYQINLLIYII